MKTHLLETKALLLATLTVVAASSVACSAQPVAEERGSTKSKLLAPRPMMKATASPTSRSALGVAEWRIFRGRNDVVLTGYDEDGKPVKGVSVGFHADSDSDEATLRTRVLDGSMFAARHEYARNRTVQSTQMPAATASFLQQALADIAVLRQAAARTSSDRTFGTTPQCGSDMMAIISNALSCIQNSGGSTNTNAVSQCITAAQSAAGVGTACQSTGTTPFDPTSGFDPWGTGMGGWDPTGQAGSCGQADPWGGGAAGGATGTTPCGGGDPWGQDPYGQGGMGADPWGGQGGMGADPYGDMGGWGGGMPTGGWCSDPFGDGASCPSCGGMGGGTGGMDDWGGGMGGGMGDICTNPMNGDVGYEGDFGGGGWGEGF